MNMVIFPKKIPPPIPNAGSQVVGYSFLVFGMTFELYFDLEEEWRLKAKKLCITEPPAPDLIH